jgi:hypothetical protein
MASDDVPAHVRLAEEKARWDAEQIKKKQGLITAEKVIIRGISIPFWDLVTLLVKIAFAAIPAAIIIAIIWGVIISLLGNILK